VSPRYLSALGRYKTRHPSSLGLLVNALGWDLDFRAGLGVLLTALMILPLLARIRAEERLLGSQFGDEYGPTAPGHHGSFLGSISDARAGSCSSSAHRCGVAEHAEPPMPA